MTSTAATINPRYIKPLATVTAAIIIMAASGLPEPTSYAKFDGNILAYDWGKSSTSSYLKTINQEPQEKIVLEFANKLLRDSVEIEHDFAKVLQDNMWDLI